MRQVFRRQHSSPGLISGITRDMYRQAVRDNIQLEWSCTECRQPHRQPDNQPDDQPADDSDGHK
jgi:hypothetical protein